MRPRTIDLADERWSGDGRENGRARWRGERKLPIARSSLYETRPFSISIQTPGRLTVSVYTACVRLDLLK